MITPDSPIQSPRRLDYAPARNFQIIMKDWMGRIISICTDFNSRLSNRITQIQQTSVPILYSSSAEKKENNKILDLEEEYVEFVVDSLFTKMGFNFNPTEEALEHAIIFDMNRKKQTPDDYHSLNGEYHLEWTLERPYFSEFPIKLLYRGNIENGLFHGQGSFFKQCPEDQCLELIAEGLFDNGMFISGIAVLEDRYIDGTFIKGKWQGKGTIHFLEAQLDASNCLIHQEYRGEFFQAKAHGKGKSFLLKDNEILLVGEGEYRNGFPSKGRFHISENNTFEGEWKTNQKFIGKITNHKERWVYEGEWNRDFEGKGKLKHTETYQYEDLQQDKKSNKLNLVKKKGRVKCISEGIFHQGALYEGKRKIKCKNGNFGIMHIEKGLIEKTKIIVPEGSKYIGDFTPYTLDGTGTIYDEDKEVYTGEIKCGYPHGLGIRKINDQEEEEGTFEFGTFTS